MSSMEPSSPILKLPPELLLNIFKSLQLVPGPTLLNCMLCCEKWHPLAQSVLYKDVVLSSLTLTKFTKQSSSSANTDGVVQTLTLRLDPIRANPDEDHEAIRQHGSQAAQQFWHSLDELAVRIKGMTKLMSLSIFRPAALPLPGFWIPQASLVRIVDNLAEACTSLEIDTRWNDHGDGAHLCPSIRSILPRMQNLRLRLTTICPEICGIGFDSARPSVVTKAYEPSEAPHLKQCIINISCKWAEYKAQRSHICGVTHDASQLSHIALATHLRTFWSSGRAPALEKLWIIDTQPQEYDRNSYAAYVRRDVHANHSQYLPLRNIGGFRKDGWLIRLPTAEGGDWVSFLRVIEDLAEGQAWQEATCGVRLAAPTMVSSMFTAMAVAQTGQQYRAQMNISCTLWRNERLAGMEILEVEERGLVEERAVQVKTPPGWRMANGDLLEKDE